MTGRTIPLLCSDTHQEKPISPPEHADSLDALPDMSFSSACIESLDPLVVIGHSHHWVFISNFKCGKVVIHFPYIIFLLLKSLGFMAISPDCNVFDGTFSIVNETSHPVNVMHHHTHSSLDVANMVGHNWGTEASLKKQLISVCILKQNSKHTSSNRDTGSEHSRHDV